MENKKFQELVEMAKEDSKNDFIRFVKGIYNVDESAFEHIWKVPIMTPYDGDKLITTTLSTRTEDELLEYIDEFIADELGNSEGCLISLSKMEEEFTDAEIEEWKKKEENGEVNLDYNAIIIYNESELKKHITECKYTVPLEEVNEETLNSNGSELSDIVVSQENIKFIHKKIKELDEKYSSVLLLNLACECSPQTIADILGININTVYSRIHIAKNKLKAKLNEYYKEEAK